MFLSLNTINFVTKSFCANLSCKEMWSRLKDVGVSGKDRISCTLPPSELLQHFFPPPTHARGMNPVKMLHNRFCPSFNFSPVSTEDVVAALLSIKSMAIGVDNISMKFFMLILPYILDTVTDLFNQFISMSNFPSR